MKKSKIIVPALAMLVMSTAATVTGTVAWFSMNKTVSATGMNVSAAAEGSLVITKSDSYPLAGTNTTRVDFGSNVNSLYASTYDWTNGDTTGLAYVTNAQYINPETGTRMNNEAGTALLLEDAVNSASKKFYVDYDVYIAGNASEFEHQDVTIAIQGTYNTDTKLINDAISVAFFTEVVTGVDANSHSKIVNAGSSTGEADGSNVLNLAGKYNIVDDGAITLGDRTEYVLEDVTIPETGTSSALSIKMRVFFDGALAQQAGTEVTEYEAATTYNAATTYYSDNKGTSVAAVSGQSELADKYVVTSGSAKTYARTSTIADIEEVKLSVSFTATDHE